MKDEVLKMAAEFDKRFTSMNGIDVPERVSVPRDEWRALNQALKQALAAPTVQEPVIDHSCKDTYELIMKWADIYAAQTGELYSQAAQDPSKAARMADERTMLACVVAQALSQPAAPMQRREHITGGSPCWCNPETDYVDPKTNAAVIVHKEPQ